MPAVEWVINQYKNRENLTTAEGKRRFTTASLTLVRQLKDAVEQEHYLKIIQKTTDVSMAALVSKLKSTGREKPPSKRTPAIKKQPTRAATPDMEEVLVGVATIAPSTRRWLSAISREMISGDETWQLLSYLQQNSESLIDSIPEELQKIEQYVKIVQLKSDTRYANWEESQFQAEMARVVKQIVIKHREIKKQQLIDQLRDAETVGDDAKAEALRRDINALIKERV